VAVGCGSSSQAARGASFVGRSILRARAGGAAEPDHRDEVYAALFEASGIPYAELLDRLVELALERHEQRSRLEY